MSLPQIVSPAEWLDARNELLVKEKAATRALDALAAELRRLPMVAVDKDYEFDGPDGRAALTDLFEGRRQVVVSCSSPTSTTRPTPSRSAHARDALAALGFAA